MIVTTTMLRKTWSPRATYNKIFLIILVLDKKKCQKIKLSKILKHPKFEASEIFMWYIQLERQCSIGRKGEHFWENTRCWDSWWNTAWSVWDIFSIKIKLRSKRRSESKSTLIKTRCQSLLSVVILFVLTW